MEAGAAAEEKKAVEPVAPQNADEEAEGVSAAEKKRLKKLRQKQKKESEAPAQSEALPTDGAASAAVPVTAAAAAPSLTPKTEADEDQEEAGDDAHAGEAKKKKKNKKKKTAPLPSVPLSKQFPTLQFPMGRIEEYSGDARRPITEEARERDRLNEGMLNDLRKAAEAHRQVRRWARATCRPGVKLFEFVETLENSIRTIIESQGLSHIEAGIAFPTGVSLNHVAAHFTPNPGDENVTVGEGDVIKIDIGTHVHGRIVDSAFSMSFNPELDPLVEASREATNTGVRLAGPDALLRDIGAEIEEVIKSYEVTVGGKTFQCKPIRNLNGHLLGPYTIHAGKSVPIAAESGDTTTRMEEGELYAIETFASTGRGLVVDDGECSHYMMAPNPSLANIRNPKARHLLAHIQQNYETLAFCNRWLDTAGETRHQLQLRALIEARAVNPYPPLVDTRGSYVSQHEQTFLLRPTCKEIISAGDDY
ncbi:putative Methionine aminopeptidase 2B [Paratrimastix pyriformis]|uniref:Methionine aminopeptidase 2 n=1 Tax=Paratrimastix pyriformis TaxID=342808 RepID=A0ABQ8UIP8_9EUKA|nr:putative Methionine aminopeptidase 2B [Paratrimastix pyriformis]